ncbi:hypothetical protein GKZ89_01615 [Bacillus mangrovi]|uniref:Uncharacterized protein n=1 Tax=Metabacillus mangrovi TaxID=1491830 RepID=A0A7X2S3E7_9BACI|nr:hypothetical protein [Metabacillus mangrovi]MTH52086.1 hypothetical protein [Metabacillus mangrovi]
MFDPTVFDNLKVILEGLVYDFDLDGLIHIRNRSDTVDLADMSRTWSIRMLERGRPEGASAGISLSVAAGELVSEWSGRKTAPGCRLLVTFSVSSNDGDAGLRRLKAIQPEWEAETDFGMKTSYDPSAKEIEFVNEITFTFRHLITEDHAGDMEAFVESVYRTIARINKGGESL